MSISKKPQFLLLFRHPNEAPDPTPEEMEQIMGRWVAWMRGMKAQGQFVAADRLEDGGKVLRGAAMTDGPFAESKEIVGGFIVVSADTLAQAAEIARGCPGLPTGTIVEVRPIEDLPEI
jgi:hypothetical protein